MNLSVVPHSKVSFISRPMPSGMKLSLIRGILCVIGGFLYHLALGYFYTAGKHQFSDHAF